MCRKTPIPTATSGIHRPVFWNGLARTVVAGRRGETPEPVGEIIPRMRRAEKTGELIKAVFVRHGRAGVTQSPGANQARAIALALEQRGHRDRVGREHLIEVRMQVTRLQSGQERRARRGVLRTARVETGETDAFLRQPVQIRRFDLGLAVTTEVTVAEVVRENQDDARTARRGWRHF